MNKFLARLLILMLGFSAFGKPIYASTALLSAETENRPDSISSVVTSLDGASPTLHEPVMISSSPKPRGEAKGAPNGQASPSAGQNSPRHHSHHARNLLIGIGVMCALALIIAVAAK